MSKVRFHRGAPNSEPLICNGRFLLQFEGVHAQISNVHCPKCQAAASAKAEREAAFRNFLSVVCHAPKAPKVSKADPMPENLPVTRRNNLEPWDRDGFTTVHVATGLQAKTTRDGKIVRKNGVPVTQVVDYTSDDATKARVRASAKKRYGKRPGLSTSVSSSWAVPAKPGSDTLGDSRKVFVDKAFMVLPEGGAARRPTKKKPYKGRKPFVVDRQVRRWNDGLK